MASTPVVTGFASLLPPVVVLPVSGQAFTNQLGIMLNLVGAGYRPKLSLGASGGAMVAANAISNDWVLQPWLNQLQAMRDVSLLKKHFLGEMQALCEPSVYKRGDGLEQYYTLLASAPAKLYRDNELIVNAYNTSLGRTELFTTATRAASQLTGTQGPLQLLGVDREIHFLGDLPDCDYQKRIRELLVATSAVPIVFDRVGMGAPGPNQQFYADGGVSFSSPLTAVSCLKELTDILYINPSDINESVPVEYGVVLENIVAYTSQITRSNALQDRYMFLHGLCCGRFDSMSMLTNKYNPTIFAQDLQRTQGRPRMVELYPLNSSHTPMTTNQSYEHYISEIMTARTEFGYRIFWVMG